MARQEKRIIVEGPDGAGKTHLIDRLMSKFHFLDLVRNEKGPDADLFEFWTRNAETERSNRVPIHDRFFYSELVYGPILRGSYQVDKNAMYNILWYIRAGSFVIYCRPGTDRIIEGLQKRPQMEGVKEHIQDIILLYDEIMAVEQTFFGNRFFMYNWTLDSDFKYLEELIERYLTTPDTDGYAPPMRK